MTLHEISDIMKNIEEIMHKYVKLSEVTYYGKKDRFCFISRFDAADLR